MSGEANNNYPLPSAKPEDVGFSSERLAQIGSGLKKYVDQQKVPNMVTLVARHGKLVHFDTRGYMDCENKKPVTKETIFRLYSNSKPVAGVVTMMLFEEGKLGLDDPVYKYIPSFRNQLVLVTNVDKPEPNFNDKPEPNMNILLPTVPANRSITIRDCLRNTTGLPTLMHMPLIYLTIYKDALTDLGLYPGSAPGKRDFRERAEALAKLPLSFQPGTDFDYHVGYGLLSVILEMVAGKPLEEFYRERIFELLGMVDTSFYLPEGKLDRFPVCYIPRRVGQEWKLVISERPETSLKVVGPKIYFDVGGDYGGLLSTAGDYSRFCQMLLNGGEIDSVRLLSRKSVEMMTANHIGDIHNTITGRGFGFGLGVSQYKGGAVRPVMRSVGTFHWGGAGGTFSFMDPKEDLLGICFTQVLFHYSMPGNLFQEDFERLVYQALI